VDSEACGCRVGDHERLENSAMHVRGYLSRIITPILTRFASSALTWVQLIENFMDVETASVRLDSERSPCLGSYLPSSSSSTSSGTGQEPHLW
jgi:hypothetical protein